MDRIAAGGGLGPGSVVAGYRIERRLGSGGMAVVYRAQDERLGRLVALKVMAEHWAGDEAFRQRFIAESRAAATVDHPHVIPVHEAGEAGGVLFIAMRLVSGSDLQQVARRDGVLAPARALDLLSPVSSALDAAHAAGLVHRDVKPANILIDQGNGRPDHVYLSDFGLSKGAVAGTSLTGTGQYLGTPQYSAPEQVQGRPVDGRTDQYSLACVAFQLLAGRVPFERGNDMATLWAHATEPPPAITGLRPELPVTVDPVLARALAKDPGDRYPSCQDFTEALRAALGLPPYASRDADGANPPAETPATRGASVLASRQAVTHTRTLLPGLAPAAAPPAARQSPQPSPTTRNDGAPSARHWTRRRLAIFTVACTVMAAAVIIPLTWPGTPPHGTLAATLADPGSQGVYSVAFSPDGKTLATGDANGHVYLWNTASGQRTATLTGADANALGVAFSPDGHTVATEGSGHTYLWDAATHALTATLTHYGLLTGVAFSPDGLTLATAVDNGNAYLWNAATHALTATLTDPDISSDAEYASGPYSVAFSPDGHTLATDGGDHVYLWNTATGQHTATLTQPGTGSRRGSSECSRGSDWGGVAFSPNGLLLASSTGDEYVCLWNTATHALIATLTVPALSGSDGLNWVAFSPDGDTLAAAEGQGNYQAGQRAAYTYLWHLTE